MFFIYQSDIISQKIIQNLSSDNLPVKKIGVPSKLRRLINEIHFFSLKNLNYITEIKILIIGLHRVHILQILLRFKGK